MAGSVAAAPLLPPESKPYQPIGAILEMWRARDREVVVEGVADSGKSRGCIEKVHGCCEKYPGARWAFVRQTRKSLTTTAMVTYERWVRPDGASTLWGEQEYRYPNGSKIYLLGMDEPNRIQSMELDGAFFQQAEEATIEGWEILSKCITGRGATMPYQQLLGDMNPVDPGFFLYAREAVGATRFITVTHADNPTITPDRLAALKSLTGYRRRRLYLGERVAAEGMFFTEWDPHVHLCDPFPIPAHWTRWTATDYGYAAPFVNLSFAREPGTKRIFVVREIHAAGLRDAQQAALITARIREEREALKVTDAKSSLYALHVGDPSMFAKRSEADQPSIASVYKAHGIDLKPASNNRKHGWQIVRSTLAHDSGPPRLQVFRGRCPNLERTLPAMVHDPLDPEDVADAIKGVKTDDHDVDALRYGLCAEASPPAPRAMPVRFGG